MALGIASVGFLVAALSFADLSLLSAAVEEALVKAGALPGDPVAIGVGDDAVVFDWEPTLSPGAELLGGPRGTDLRLDTSARPTRGQKRDRMRERYAARAATQAELEAERKAGHWATARDTDEP